MPERCHGGIMRLESTTAWSTIRGNNLGLRKHRPRMCTSVQCVKVTHDANARSDSCSCWQAHLAVLHIQRIHEHHASGGNHSQRLGGPGDVH